MYYLLYPKRTYLIVSGKGNKRNVMAADWLTPLSSKPFLVGVAISPKNFSHQLINENKEFVISVPTLEMLDDVWIVGRNHGPEKLKKTKLTFVPSVKIETPGIKEAVANLECKVIDTKKYGNYTFFVGEVIHYTYNKEIFPNNRADVKKAKFLAHSSWAEFVANEEKIYRKE